MIDNLNEQFFHAVSESNLSKVKEILSDSALNQKINRNQIDDNGSSALHLSLLNRQEEIAWILIKSDWKLDLQNKGGKIPLHYAADRGFLDIVKFYLEHGYNLDPKTTDGMTPLHFAAYHNQPHVVSFLLDHGMNVNILDENKLTPIHNAAYEGHCEMISLFASRGAKLELNTKWGTPIMIAQANQHMEAVDLLNDLLKKE